MIDIAGKFNFNFEFQIDVISYLLKDSVLYRKFIKFIKSEYFTEYQLIDIFKTSKTFFKKYDEVITKSSLLNELERNVFINSNKKIEDYIDIIDKIYTFEFNKKYVEDNLIDFISIQSVYKGLRDAYNSIEDGKKVLSIIEESVKIKNSILFDGGYDYKDNVNNRINNLEKGIRVENQIACGIDCLDKITDGGLGAGELGVIIGQTGQGKSIFLLNVALFACALGKNVIYFTMEASHEILASRMDGNISGYTKEEMLNKKDKLFTAITDLPGNLKIKEFPSSVTTALEMANFISDLIANGFIPDLAIFDYLGIMAPVISHKETRTNLGQIAKDIIRLVLKKFNIPGWSAQQASDIQDCINTGKEYKDQDKNRKELEKVMGIGDIAEGKVTIASEVDLLVTMNQNYLERKTKPFEGMRFHVPKNRLGPDKGTYPIEIDKTRFIIRDRGLYNSV